MVEIKKQILKEINDNCFGKNEQIILSSLIIEKLDLGFREFNTSVIIENCIVEELIIHSCWFSEGLIFKNNIVKKDIDYQMGGHNNKSMEISNNIFYGFFNFFDCEFDNQIIINNNIFKNGSNLLGNTGKGFQNIFKKGIIAENNIGDIKIND